MLVKQDKKLITYHLLHNNSSQYHIVKGPSLLTISGFGHKSWKPVVKLAETTHFPRVKTHHFSESGLLVKSCDPRTHIFLLQLPVTVLAQLHIWHKPRTLPGSPICTVCLFAPPLPDPLPIRTSPAPPASSLLFFFPSLSFALYINPSLKSQAKSGQGYQIS